MALRGHEWIGGAAGFDNRHHAPQNSSLLLVGIISGSKNFDVRSWLRRAFWQQRPWRLGVEWRFVVGTRLPRGDNDRVSLHYEAARHGDLDLIQGSEVPPRQARVAMRWWLKAAAYVDQAQADGSGGPRYIGLTYDSLIVSLPLLALRLRSIQPAIGRGGGRRTRQLVYGGPLRWALWTDGATARSTWRCVRTTTPPELLEARLPGDAAPSKNGDGALSGRTRKQAERGRSSCSSSRTGASPTSSFLAAAPELQLLSSELLLRAYAALRRRLHLHQLEVKPPSELWDASLVHHQTAAGRTPSQPALLAATALARAVHNVSEAQQGAVTYVQLSHAATAPKFDWEMVARTPTAGPCVLFARSVTDGIAAEAVVDRFGFGRPRVGAAMAGRTRCSRSRCAAWWGEEQPPPPQAMCCEADCE